MSCHEATCAEGHIDTFLDQIATGITQDEFESSFRVSDEELSDPVKRKKPEKAIRRCHAHGAAQDRRIINRSRRSHFAGQDSRH